MHHDLQIGRLYLSLQAIMETSAIEGVADCVNRLHFRKGETILHEGDTLQHLYYLAKGRVRAVNNNTDTEKTFSYISAGYFICEAAFFAKSTNIGLLVAETSCEIWSFSERYVYEQLLQQHPEIALHIIRSLSIKMVGIYHHVNDLTTRQPHKALAQLLLPWMEEQGVLQTDGSYILNLALTHQQLADLLGLHRVTVTKTLNEWKQQGILTKNRKDWHIYQPDYLQQLLEY